MMCDRCVRLTKLPSEFVFCQMRKEDSCGRVTGKGPLQEVNFGALAFSREWKNELGVASRSLLYTGI